jgi:sulfate/thiosulfate transport system ATP-binding protein
VMNDGRIEQVGAPRDLYERPANEFVMTFVGPTTQIDGEYARPHDLELVPADEHGGIRAEILRVVHLGFEVRVELLTETGEEVTVQLTREEAAGLAPSVGDRVCVRSRERAVSAS